jgi:hypothetical protein
MHRDYVSTLTNCKRKYPEFKPMSPHSMCVQLLTRPLHQNDKHFCEKELRFETFLGCINLEETIQTKRKALTIILVRTERGQYQRVVDGECNLGLNYFDDVFSSLSMWSLTDVFISNPQPNLPTPLGSGRYFAPIVLNCATALKSGVEIGGFWVEHDDIKVEDISGGKIYTSTLSYPKRPASKFTVRNVKSGEMCGLILSAKTRGMFDLSIVYGLNETQFTDQDSFTSLLKESPALESRNPIQDVLGYKLQNGGHLFLSCENLQILSWRDSETEVRLRVGIVY